MSPRAFLMSVLMLSLCPLLAVSMLAMLSAEPDRVMRREPREPSIREMSVPSTGESCDRAVLRKWVDLPLPGPGRILQC
jgi:hypothetical protein